MHNGFSHSEIMAFEGLPRGMLRYYLVRKERTESCLDYFFLSCYFNISEPFLLSFTQISVLSKSNSKGFFGLDIFSSRKIIFSNIKQQQHTNVTLSLHDSKGNHWDMFQFDWIVFRSAKKWKRKLQLQVQQTHLNHRNCIQQEMVLILKHLPMTQECLYVLRMQIWTTQFLVRPFFKISLFSIYFFMNFFILRLSQTELVLCIIFGVLPIFRSTLIKAKGSRGSDYQSSLFLMLFFLRLLSIEVLLDDA